jgi:hypothetical protein
MKRFRGCICRAFGDTCVTFGVGRSNFKRLYMLDNLASYLCTLNPQYTRTKFSDMYSSGVSPFPNS